MRNISDTKRGLSWQSRLSESSDVPIIGGDNIVRYGTHDVKGFVDSEDLDTPNNKVDFLRQPKVMLQRIIAHITDPKPHIKIMATADQTGEVLRRRYSREYASLLIKTFPQFLSQLF